LKNHRPRHDAIDLYMRELDSCPPLTAAEEQEAEEQEMSLRMLRLRKRLAVLLGGLPEPQRGSSWALGRRARASSGQRLVLGHIGLRLSVRVHSGLSGGQIRAWASCKHSWYDSISAGL